MNKEQLVSEPRCTYKGQGTLKINDEEAIECRFIFEQNQSGENRLVCEHDPREPPPRFVLKAYFEGKTDEGYSFNIKEVFYAGFNNWKELQVGFVCGISFYCSDVNIKSSSQEKPHFMRAPIVNLRAEQSSYLETTFSDSEFRFENGLIISGRQMPLEIGNEFLTILLLLEHSATTHELKEKRSIGITCEIIIPIADRVKVSAQKNRLNILCSLLTFIYSTRVNWIGFDLVSESGTLLQRYCANNPVRACLHKDGFRRLYLCLARKSKFIPAI